MHIVAYMAVVACTGVVKYCQAKATDFCSAIRGVVMSLTHAILAGLWVKPHTGYELAKEFSESVGNFWTASHQQIYRELEKIQKGGWAKVKAEEQDGKPDRKIYSISEKGKKELLRWMEDPLPPLARRDPLLVKLYIGHIAPKPLLQELVAHRKLHVETLAHLQAIEKRYFSDPKEVSEKDKFKYFTLRRGLLYEEAWLKWCDEVVSGLQSQKV